MGKTYGVNMADQHLVVGSIEVIGDMSGKGISTIKQKIDALEQQQVFTPATKNYWSELVSDGVINPIEKKTIKQQWQEVESVYTQLYQQAQLQEKTTEIEWLNYDDAYYALKIYLEQTLSLFDDMTTSTPIEDRDKFNWYFSVYYSNQSAVQILLTQGEPGRIRTLSNLHETGYDGEIAMYRSWFYTYSEKYQKWESVPNDEYLGVCSTMPTSRAKNQYFLANANFKTSSSLIMVNKKVLKVAGKMIMTSYYATKGNIYVWDGLRWVQDTNRNSYRYFIATNDILVNDGDLSPAFQEAVLSVTGTTGYLGMFTGDPDQPPFNSYYVYIGDTTDTRTNGSIYIFKHTGWQLLDPSDADNYGYYMKTLKDTLGTTAVKTGAFSTLFCNVLAANNAFITKLFSEQITLLANGFIQSNGYTSGSKGFKIDANGHAEFNDITLGSGASVHNADYATSAGSATTAGSATNATNVTAGEIKQMVLAANKGTEVELQSYGWGGPGSATGFGIYSNGDAHFGNGSFRGAVVCTSLGVEDYVAVGSHFTLDKTGKVTMTQADINGKCAVDKLHFDRTYSASETNFENGDIWIVDL